MAEAEAWEGTRSARGPVSGRRVSLGHVRVMVPAADTRADMIPATGLTAVYRALSNGLSAVHRGELTTLKAKYRMR